MRYVIVPEPVTLVDNDGKPQQELLPGVVLKPGERPKPEDLRDIGPISLHRFLMLFVINEESPSEKPGERGKPKIGVGYEGDKRSAKLDRLFEESKPGDVVAVEDKDWETVKKILEEKLWQPKDVGRQLFPLTEAWMEASDKKPALKVLDAPAGDSA